MVEGYLRTEGPCPGGGDLFMPSGTRLSGKFGAEVSRVEERDQFKAAEDLEIGGVVGDEMMNSVAV